LLRTAKRILNRQDLIEMYQFEYHLRVPYNEKEELAIRFDFCDQDDLIPRRLYAIIGENGTGKTHLLNQLPFDYISQKADLFNDRLPLYSKIIKVSTSFYDDYPEPPMSETSNFVYCGFRSHCENGNRQIRDVMQERIAGAIEKIKKKRWEDGEGKLYPILKRFLPESYVEEMCDESCNFEIDKILGIVNKMSSGECNMFFMICDILANIRFDSLILFDEPEVHMHPNAITMFMNIVYSILEQYKSFAIITTHSPLIVREILGENVYVMERNDDIPVIRKIGMESFAANLTDLYNEVFSNKDTRHYYEAVLGKLKYSGMTADDVLDRLRSESLDPNLNMRLMIMNMFDAENEED
jgi:predicted ATPase